MRVLRKLGDATLIVIMSRGILSRPREPFGAD
jgi:hypothetical protein